jgi:hypothetical protein
MPRRDRIISFTGQPDVIKRILQHLGLWEEFEAPLKASLSEKEKTQE